jgi:predicted transcriptional regulator
MITKITVSELNSNLKDLIKKGIVKKVGNEYILTPEGERIEKLMLARKQRER